MRFSGGSVLFRGGEDRRKRWPVGAFALLAIVVLLPSTVLAAGLSHARFHPPLSPRSGQPIAVLPDPRLAPLPATGSPAVTGNASGWVGLGSIPPVPPQGLAAYDAADDVVVIVAPDPNLAGGSPSAPAFAATYTFNGTAWAELAGVRGPSYQAAGSLSYDSAAGQVVYVYPSSVGPAGGVTETWAFSAGHWSQRGSAVTPPARAGAALADDPRDGGVLLFGGSNASDGTLRNGSWLLTGAGWAATAASGVAPDPRSRSSAAWDASSHRVVLLGGCHAAGVCLNDTWWFASGLWHPVATAGPDLSASGALRFVVTDDLTGGGVLAATVWAPSSPTTSAGLWEYASGVWTALPTSGAPFAIAPSALIELNRSVGRALVEFPAVAGSASGTASAWIDRAGVWNSALPIAPSARSGAALTFDPASGYYLLFGGNCSCGASGRSSESWAYQNGGWRKLAVNNTPPARSGAGLVYDAADGYALLFGGGSPTTWEFTQGGWTRLTPSVSPPNVSIESMVYDAADGYVLWIGGTAVPYTYTFHAGNWTNRSGSVHPPGLPRNPLVYDSADQYVLLVGPSVGASGTASPETWSYFAGSWTNRSSATGPSARSGASLFDDPAEAGIVLLGGVGAPGPSNLGDTWRYAAGTWTRSAAWYGPSARSGAAAATDPTPGTSLLFGGIGGSGNGPMDCPSLGALCNDSWAWSAAGGAVPYVTGFTGAPPEIDSGHTATFSVSVAAGSAPYRYNYSGLPTDCPTADRSVLTCTSRLPGNYSVVVLATDTAGLSALASASLRVFPPLSVNLNVSPARMVVGGETLFSSRAAGGTGQYAYQYGGLPPGCSTQSVPTLPCWPASAGGFAVHVLANDTGGELTGAWVNLTVGAAGIPGGPRIDGFSVVPAAIVLGNGSTISVNASGGVAPLRYSYAGAPCPATNTSSFFCQPSTAGRFEITVTATDAALQSVSVLTNLTVYPVGGGGAAVISSFTASPSSFTLGASTVLSVDAAGGRGPLTYQYPSLPPGCTSANLSRLPCSPTLDGSFTTYVVVSDSAGNRSGAFGHLLVSRPGAPVPAISLFAAAPHVVRVGDSTTFIATVAGGEGPVRYDYRGLPGGCPSLNLSSFDCTPDSPGNFTIALTVTDALGRNASASTGLEVLPALAPVGPPPGGVLRSLEGLASGAGIATVAFVVAAGFVLLGTELGLRQRRVRREGEALVRAMAESARSADRSEGP